MGKITFDAADVDLICSYLRVGADLDTALTAMVSADGAPWPEDVRTSFAKAYDAEIKSAQAQCRVLCLHNIMTEGGVNSSRFILGRLEGGPNAEPGPEKPRSSGGFF